mmetsp:Transcript_14422/g.43045  ORF Transcript_14422/g.43045 Transcript_14422/m.43045 type:complete len:396 (-) Transcript_14422:26-1213(-)
MVTDQHTLGICLIMLGCLMSAAGMLFMKQSSVAYEHTLKPWQRWRFGIGLLLLVVNAAAVDVVVYGIVPLSIIAPFAGMTIVFTTLLSAAGVITERQLPSRRGAAGTLLVVAGLACVSSFGPRGDGRAASDPSLSPAALSLVCAALSFGSAWLALRCGSAFESRIWRRGSAATTLCTALASACFGMATNVAMKRVSALASECVADRSLGPAREADALALAALLVLPVAAPLQLWLLNSALAEARTAFAVPAYQSALIGLNLAAAGLLFGEYDGADARDLSFFGGGVLCAAAGLATLSLEGASDVADKPLFADGEPSERGSPDSVVGGITIDVPPAFASPGAQPRRIVLPPPSPTAGQVLALGRDGLAIAALSPSSPFARTAERLWGPKSAPGSHP